MKHHRFDALRIVLAGLPACCEFLAPVVSGRPSEMLAVAFVDNECSLLSLTTYPGGAQCVSVPINEILREAVALKAAGIILAHNHPSGQTVPSEGDFKLTKRVVQAAEIMDVVLLDHIIFNGTSHFSFRSDGYI